MVQNSGSFAKFLSTADNHHRMLNALSQQNQRPVAETPFGHIQAIVQALLESPVLIDPPATLRWEADLPPQGIAVQLLISSETHVEQYNSTFPGLNRLFGSRVRLMVHNNATVPSPSSCTRYLFLLRPTPCSPVPFERISLGVLNTTKSVQVPSSSRAFDIIWSRTSLPSLSSSSSL
jgi:hypothetical protein